VDNEQRLRDKLRAIEAYDPTVTLGSATTVWRAPERFFRDLMVEVLYAHLSSVADRVIAEVIEADRGDAIVLDRALQLEAFVTEEKQSLRAAAGS